ncbi:MAG: hypothetical protein JWM16_3592 [Verrucomicrobiales bacterium]|nr:hypothetical protein [Verrucomicrobiales bacterium]
MSEGLSARNLGWELELQHIYMTIIFLKPPLAMDVP